jgi:hypothetical protein
MSSKLKLLVAVLVGFFAGAPVWGVAGYVVNDLTSKVNPAKEAVINKAEQAQQDLDALFKQLATQPPAGQGAGSGQPTAK